MLKHRFKSVWSYGRYCAYSALLLVSLFVIVPFHAHARAEPAKIQVQIAVIITGNNSRLFSIDRVKPCMDYVIEKLNDSNLLPPNVELIVHYKDSKCNTKDGPVAAFNLIAQNAVDVFIGPVCDYSLAPVARYAPYWNLPVISPGGFAHDFGFSKFHADPEFPTLTRIGATFNSLAYSIIDTILFYKWSKIKFIYDGEGHGEVMPSFCFLAGSSLIYYIKQHVRRDTNQSLDHDFYLYVPRKDNIEKMIKNEIGNTYSSKLY